MEGVYFGRYFFDPKLICYKILLTQCIFYLGLSCIIWILDFNSKHRVSLSQIFRCTQLSLYSQSSQIIWISHLINAFIGGVALLLIVERARKCLDYTFTAYFIHFILCYMNCGLPDGWEIWLCWLVSIVVMTTFGEHLCIKREMKEIPLHGSYMKIPES
eukprot:c4149_g1_i1.p1 GENE.c4149_g1_i1~~c4149_g1_i1.p1  ORF type:complete len:159 (+),score=35.48 c4149_g1_i1:8-484(+)